MSTPLFAIFGMPGHMEILIIGVIILLLFGHRLPGIMRSLGKGIVEFKKGVNDVQDDVESSVEKAGEKGKVEDKAEEPEKAAADDKS